MGVIEELWQAYREAVIPAGAGDVQLKECRRAFYAGCSALFDAVTDGLSDTGDPDEVTKEDLDLMDDIAAELQAFCSSLKEGGA